MRIATILSLSAMMILTLILAGCPPRQATTEKTSEKEKTPYVIGAVFDVTGMGSPLGTPERDTVLMLEKEMNAKGGINGHPLKVIILDNASEEAKSLTAVKNLIEKEKVLAIIGPSQTGTTLAAAATVEEAKVPMVSCAAGVGIVDPVKPYIFKTAQSDVHAVAKVLDYCTANKLNKIAVISVANAFGESGKLQIQKQAKAAKISIVAEESFGPDDTNMTAQVLRMRAKKPDAVICWGTNPGPATVAKNMKTLEFKVPLIMSHGIANRKFIELAGDGAEGVVFPAGKLLVADSLLDTNPQKAVLLKYADDFSKAYKRDADTFGGHAYDAFMLVCQALEESGPDREKLRDAIEAAQMVGISGAFNFNKTDHNGLQKDAFEMVEIKGGKWIIKK
jgi:branched-chain amino acid transport system substrate-binding protein